MLVICRLVKKILFKDSLSKPVAVVDKHAIGVSSVDVETKSEF